MSIFHIIYSHTFSHTNTIEPQDLETKHISFFSSRFIQILIEKHIGDDWSAYPECTPRSPTPQNKALLKKGLWKPLVSLNKASYVLLNPVETLVSKGVRFVGVFVEFTPSFTAIRLAQLFTLCSARALSIHLGRLHQKEPHLEVQHSP